MQKITKEQKIVFRRWYISRVASRRKDLNEALDASIRHWTENERLAKNGTLTVKNIGADECALCQVNINQWGDINCGICPITMYSGISCNSSQSPWSMVLRLWFHGDFFLYDSKIASVHAMLLFLKRIQRLMRTLEKEIEND